MSASQAELLASLPEAERAAILADLTDDEAAALEYDWHFWGRPDQIAPVGDWATWIALCGRGWGKTEAGAQWIRQRVENGARSLAIIAETQKDLEEVMVPRIVRAHPPKLAPSVRYKPVRLTWPNGAVALGYNGTEPNQLRGPEFDTAWVDELAKYRSAQETWDMLQFTMRRGDPRVFVTTTPRPIPIIKTIIADRRTVVTRGNTFDNAANLPRQFIDKLKERYAGTRLGRQELNAEILDDVQGALWTREMIDAARAPVALPDMARVVVAVDPSGARGAGDEKADSIGIVVAGKGVDGRGYVLADRTCKLSPAGWGRRAVETYREFKADRIVAERNFGGAMVEAVIRTADPNVSFKEVVASRGKIQRAEPVAALYEQGRVSHVGPLEAVEDQLCVAKGTLVETSRGQVKIEELTSYDLVMTRAGFAPIKWVGQTGVTSNLIYISTISSELRVTTCHPIFLANCLSFVPAGNVSATDILLESRKWVGSALRSSGVAGGITKWNAGIIGTQKASFFIEKCMKAISDRYPRASMFITKMKIRAIICRQILSRCLMPITMRSTSASALTNFLDQSPSACVSSADRKREPFAPSPRAIAAIRASSECDAETPEAVYNLSVRDGFLPEYYANGILVHNCQMTAEGYVGDGSPDRADALVWALTELMVGDIAPGQALWELTRREAREDAERKPAEKLKPEPAKGSLEYMKALS